MGPHLNAAKRFFPGPTRGLLEGGRYALLHTRTMEFDDLRPYVTGDEIRDIDWKASARAGTVLIRRYISEKHHKILMIADAGRNMSALTPSGEVKRDVAAHVLGAFGLITLGRADEVAMVYGDERGSVRVGARRGENHIEALLHRFYRTHPHRPRSQRHLHPTAICGNPLPSPDAADRGQRRTRHRRTADARARTTR